MIFKILKAEVKNENKNGSTISIKISQGKLFQVSLTPRKIKNKVANFFGENIQIPIFNKKMIKKILFQLQLATNNSREVIVDRFDLTMDFRNKNAKNETIIFFQRTEIKLVWNCQIQNPQSLIETSFTHDLDNIQTPRNKTMLISGLWSNQLRQFLSEQNKNKNKNNIYFTNQLSFLSEKEQKGTLYKNNTQIIKKVSNELCKNEQQIIIKHIKNASNTTHSKTHSKKQLKQERICNLNTLIGINEAKADKNKNKQIRAEIKRRHSLNINKMGTIVASTMGILFGLASGIATHI